MAVEQGDLVNLLGVETTPWRVCAHKASLQECNDVAENIEGWTTQTWDYEADAEEFSVLMKNGEVKIMPSSKVHEPAEGAWFK